jgi:hypothetical protein
MPSLFFLALVAVTSTAAYGLGRRWLGAPRAIGPAAARTAETIGVAVVFHAANVGLIVATVLALRTTGTFLSIYAATDETLVIVSSLQALAFQLWRYSGGRPEKP